VYCKTADPALYVGREHVIPQSFGGFADNLIARNVCDGCNAYFAKELDRILARGTFGGFSRFRYGVKKPQEYKGIGRDNRIRFEAQGGPWRDQHLDQRVSDDGTNLQVTPSKQVGLAATKGPRMNNAICLLTIIRDPDLPVAERV